MSVELEVKLFVRKPSVVNDAIATALRWRDSRTRYPDSLVFSKYGVPPPVDTTRTIYAETASYVSPALATGREYSVEERWFQYTMRPTFYDQERSAFCLVDMTLNQVKPKIFRFQIDTGSQVTWLFSNRIPASQRPRGPHNPSRAVKIYRVFPEQGVAAMGSPIQSRNDHPTADRMIYVDGSRVDYTLHADNFLLKTSFRNSAWTHQWVSIAFGATSKVSSHFDESPFDGLLGLSLEKSAVSPFLETLLRNNIMTEPAITFDLFHNKIVLGSDLTLYRGDQPSNQWNGPVPFSARMAITSREKMVGDIKLTSKFSTAVLDTGSNFIYLSHAVVAEFYAGIPGAFYNQSLKAYVVPIASLSRSPLLQLQIGTGFAKFPSFLLAGPAVKGYRNLVEGAIQSVELLQTQVPHEIWGLPFFKCTILKFCFDTSNYADNMYDKKYNQPLLYWMPILVPA